MANPQPENGYLKIANELAKNFCKLRLSGNDWLIVWAVILKTYGWNKKEDMISLSQFQKITGLSRPTVVRKIQRLVRYRVLGSSKGDTRTTSTYWIIKDYDKWKPSSKIDTSSRFATRPSKKPVRNLVAEQQPTKDNIQKTIKDRFDFSSLWFKYPNKDGRSSAEKHFNSTVKTENDFKNINTALDKYLTHLSLQENDWKKPKNGSTWFNNWKDWVDWIEPKKPSSSRRAEGEYKHFDEK